MGKLKFALFAKISLFNLFLVAVFGVVMRYKIGFAFPYFDQKHLQHGHSHFAFSAWVSQTILLLILYLIKESLSPKRERNYSLILWANIITAFGMLVSFSLQGYGVFSIIFASFSLIISFVYSVRLYIDTTTILVSSESQKWFKAAIAFNLLSSLGTFALQYMMVTKNIPQHSYLASVYWYLHFQYNGWFLFSCLGIFIAIIEKSVTAFTLPKNVFKGFAVSCIPAYGLSTLWMDLPLWVYVIIVGASFLQAYAWIVMLRSIINQKVFLQLNLSIVIKALLVLAAISITIKLTLQLGSTIPYVSRLAFGFRPIVIAYLHLVFLGIVSVFLIAALAAFGLLKMSKIAIISIVIFITGVYLNEIALAVQGIGSFSYTMIPGMNVVLFVLSLFMFSGILLLFLSQLSIVVND